MRGSLLFAALLAVILMTGSPHDAIAKTRNVAVHAEPAQKVEQPASHGAETAHEEPGLPQLDPRYYAGQAFWLVITFGFTFAMMSFFAVPRVQKVLEKREKRIEEDLETARVRNEEVKRMSSELDLRLKDARLHAQDLLKEVSEKASANLAEAVVAQQKTLDQKLAEAEAGISNARQKALSALDESGVSIVEIILKRLGKISVTPDQARKAWLAVKES